VGGLQDMFRISVKQGTTVSLYLDNSDAFAAMYAVLEHPECSIISHAVLAGKGAASLV
jgi:hypothetical protein